MQNYRSAGHAKLLGKAERFNWSSVLDCLAPQVRDVHDAIFVASL